MQGEALVRNLKAKGVRFATGLSEAETGAAEKAYGLRFPPDFRALVKAGVLNGLPPFSPEFVALSGPRLEGGFYDWRDLRNAEIRDAIREPVRGIVEQIEAQELWPAAWGERPTTHRAVVAMADQRMRPATRLVPIHRHAYLPQEPFEAGNPVFSFHGGDIICISKSLEDHLLWLARPLPGVRMNAPRAKAIPFWDEWVEYGEAAGCATPGQ